MSIVNVYIHFTWSTKRGNPLLDNIKLREMLWTHLKDKAADLGIHLMEANGGKEHCHCVVNLKAGQTIDKIAKNLKGESSHWINQNKLTTTSFQWQKGYRANSVSYSGLQNLLNYVRNQEKHHGDTEKGF